MSMNSDIIKDVMSAIDGSDASPYVLKGGTALMLCYKLDRESVDIDLDCPGSLRKHDRDDIGSVLIGYADHNGYQIREAKSTDMVNRYFINYGQPQPLKIEISYRRADIPKEDIAEIDGIKTYTIDYLCKTKTAAYLSRDKIRDLYDVTFIVDRFADQLDATTIEAVRNAFEYKDLAQFDYLVATQDDPLIDKEKLLDRFLKVYEKVGLMPAKSLDGKDAIKKRIEDSKEESKRREKPHDPGRSPRHER